MSTKQREAPRPEFNAHCELWRPGDLFLDRYMLSASKQEREVARENLQEFVEALMRIATRRARDELTGQPVRAKFDAS